MHRYAQITPNGMCISILQLSEEIEDARLIPLSESDDVNPRDTWDGEKWTTAPPLPEPEPQPDRIEQLEQENADLKMRVADMELAFAEILTGGI